MNLKKLNKIIGNGERRADGIARFIAALFLEHHFFLPICICFSKIEILKTRQSFQPTSRRSDVNLEPIRHIILGDCAKENEVNIDHPEPKMSFWDNT